LHPLLAAILGAPDDDLVHHAVYADELQRAGDPRGELIAIELALAASPDRQDLRARRAELRATHGEAWWPGIPTDHVRTRHGFVDAVAVLPDQIDRVVELARTEPLRSLELRGKVPPEVLARIPPVQHLVVHELDDAALQALLVAPCATTLSALDISGHDFSAVFSGTVLPACRRLSVAATWVEASDLVEWQHLGALRMLDVSLTRHRYFELHHVLAHTPHLEELRVSCVDDFEVPETLAALARLRSLARVESYGNLHNPDRTAVVRAALPATAELLTATPDRFTVDLLGRALVFDASGAVDREGERIPLHTRFTESYSIASSTKEGRDDPATVQLLIEALACRGPRILTATGCTVAAALLPWDNRVDAEIEILDTHVELALEHYID
jgi:uncharacterized protein (TIGR02996 family)